MPSQTQANTPKKPIAPEDWHQFIRSVQLRTESIPYKRDYPYNLKAVAALEELGALDFHPNVTFLIGENGSGKSTLLEAIAIGCGFNAEGGTKNFTFETAATHATLHEALQIIRGTKRQKDGFFLRAESFYNLATSIDDMDREGMGNPIIASYGGKSLHQQSHGESFMALFMNRFSGNGLYILDEPEAALSPTRQMAMLSRMHDLVKEGAQFIIATHSPILITYPHAVIYSIDQDYESLRYDQTEHFMVMKQFMNHPDLMLDRLLEE